MLTHKLSFNLRTYNNVYGDPVVCRWADLVV